MIVQHNLFKIENNKLSVNKNEWNMLLTSESIRLKKKQLIYLNLGIYYSLSKINFRQTHKSM